MFNELKIKQVIDAINANGISSFDDYGLTDVLSILNTEELDEIERIILTKSGNLSVYDRVRKVRPAVENKIGLEMYRIKHSPAYTRFQECLQNGDYTAFLEQSTIMELADIKKMLQHTTYKKETELRAADRFISLITDAIRRKERMKKPLQ